MFRENDEIYLSYIITVMDLGALHAPPPDSTLKHVAWRSLSQLTESECGSNLSRMQAAIERAQTQNGGGIRMIASRLLLVKNGVITPEEEERLADEQQWRGRKRSRVPGWLTYK